MSTELALESGTPLFLGERAGATLTQEGGRLEKERSGLLTFRKTTRWRCRLKSQKRDAVRNRRIRQRGWVFGKTRRIRASWLLFVRRRTPPKCGLTTSRARIKVLTWADVR